MGTSLVPAAPAGLSTASKRAIDQLEAQIGGREVLIDALASLKSTEEQRYIFGLVADPRHSTLDLAAICALGNISPGELLDWYKQATFARAQVLAIHAVAAQLPAVAEDLMTRARAYRTECDRCDGDGTVTPKATKANPEPVPVPCRKCKGSGEMVVEPDLDRQKVALELGGLISKGGGMVIAMNQTNVVRESGGRNFASVMAEVDRVVDRAGDAVIDVVPEPSAEEPRAGSA